jgi:hypothetical protein
MSVLSTNSFANTPHGDAGTPRGDAGTPRGDAGVPGKAVKVSQGQAKVKGVAVKPLKNQILKGRPAEIGTAVKIKKIDSADKTIINKKI